MILLSRTIRALGVLSILLVGTAALAACGNGYKAGSNTNHAANQSVATLAGTNAAGAAAASAGSNYGYGYGAAPAAAAATAATTAASGKPDVMTATAGSFGTILVDASGDALYHFDKDTATSSACTAACANIWPPLTVSTGQPTAGAGVSGKLGLLARSDGTQQVTYNGSPLYRYSQDTAPGQVHGDGVGGVWHVAKP